MDETARIARKLSALAELGLERVEDHAVASDAVRVDRRTHKVTGGRPAMGTYVSISALARSRERAEQAIGSAFQEMDRLVKLLNRFDGASAVTCLNQQGRLRDAPPEVSTVIERSLHYHEICAGAFDISVKPLLDLFQKDPSGATGDEPDRRELASALELVGSRDIEMTGRTIGFRKAGMGITLDGIAKGYIVDRMAAVLSKHRVTDYLINAGGDIRAAGTKEKRRPWTVAVQDPAKAGDFPDVVHLRDACVATSGSYEIYFDRERLFHHLVSSRTGRSPNLNTSVSVIAPTTMAADALATSVFVMDPHEAVGFVESLPRCECLIIDKDGYQRRSSGWRSARYLNEDEAWS
ncbi:MAG: FAD:protein FMN transferase [Gemmatimonadota bacterium]|nr:MAG: FAD:protein FMN transferase [Gemmatimonadota bacterium]